MSGDSRPRRTRFDLKDESGQVLLFVVGALMTLLVVSAFVIDVGHVFWAKRKLQSSADAAALAGAFDLPNTTGAMASARQYSGSAGRRNHEIPGTVTDVCISGYPATASCSPEPNKVIVVERATVNTFFGGLVGVGSYNISARAVASRGSGPVNTPLAIYVHELCGATTGNKGLIAGNRDIEIQGGIHVNGHFEIKSPEFVSAGKATLYRPIPNPPPGPPPQPMQGQGCTQYDQSDSLYCADTTRPDCTGGPFNTWGTGPYRDWATTYHTPGDVTNPLLGGVSCTHNLSQDTLLTGVVPDARVYCLPPDKKFTINGTLTGPGGAPARITVVAGYIELFGVSKLKPYDDSRVPVLFYSTNSAGTEIKMNPSGATDWEGYIINRRGGIVVNALGVTSPYKGLLEAEWIDINSESFTMLGTFPDSAGSGATGPLALDE